MLDFTVIIPARYASTRLPGKPLLDINGLPMIVRVLQQAQQSGAQRIIVATDHIDIKKVVEQYGGEACMTCGDHQSGTERLAEVVNQYQLADETIIVNVQGDEPLIPPVIIRQVAQNLADNPSASMATLATSLHDVLEINDPNIVKVVLDQQGYALYFSRAPIPWNRDQTPVNVHPTPYLRHIGIYAYRASAIREYVTLPETPLERLEKLEQLKLLWYRKMIHVALAIESPPVGVDTLEDLLKINRLLDGTPSAL